MNDDLEMHNAKVQCAGVAKARLRPVDEDEITASMLKQGGAAVSDADKAHTARIKRLLELPPGSPVPSDGPRKRGRPITRAGALAREMGFSRLGAWKATRLAEIPKGSVRGFARAERRDAEKNRASLRNARHASPGWQAQSRETASACSQCG
jgi:hypothetical protein